MFPTKYNFDMFYGYFPAFKNTGKYYPMLYEIGAKTGCSKLQPEDISSRV